MIIPEIEFKFHTLSNGLKVFLHRNTKIPVVSVHTMFHVGSKYEEDGKSGLAHLFEHLMFEGSPNVKPGQFDLMLQNRGGNSNAYTSYDVTSYHMTVPSNELEFALWLDSDRYTGFNVSEESLEIQKDVVLEEKLTYVDNSPYGSVEDESSKRLFSNSGYKRAVIGEMDDVKNLTLTDLKNFFNKYYHSENSVISVSGDIDYDESLELITKYYSAFNKGVKTEKPEFKDPELSNEKIDVVYDKITNPGIFLNYRVPKVGEEDFYAFKIISNLLSSGKSSMLYKDLIYDLQLCNEVSAGIYGAEDVGLFSISAISNEDKTPEEILEKIDLILERIFNGEFPDSVYSKILNKIETDFYKTRNLINTVADRLCYYQNVLNNPNLINSEIKKYFEFDKNKIISAAKKYLQKNKRVVLFYMPEKN